MVNKDEYKTFVDFISNFFSNKPDLIPKSDVLCHAVAV